jgi:hypothetical protein
MIRNGILVTFHAAKVLSSPALLQFIFLSLLLPLTHAGLELNDSDQLC